MRLTKISVKQLFETFDHSISLKADQGITIIHGPNGLGKTTLLRMVKDVLSHRLNVLKSIPFSEFSLAFDDGSEILVKKTFKEQKSEARDKRVVLSVIYLDNGVEKDRFEYATKGARDAIEQAATWIDRRVPGVSRAGADAWYITSEQEMISTEEMVERYADMLPVEMRLPRGPEWFERITSGLHVRLIETQRLLRTKLVQPRHYDMPGERSHVPVIEMHSDELVKLIQEQFGQYASLSQSLDRSFPMRLVQQKEKTSLSDSQLHERFKDLDAKRSRHEQAGLLGKEDTRFEIPREMDEATRGVLSVYIADVERKLSVFDELAAKIDLFRQIINDRFAYKKLGVSKNKGFTIVSTRNGTPLETTSLSSGEQHEVVLLYELLFQVSRNSLILIDEPEISLHIAWQEQFLNDLKHIIQLSPFDAVIATHSPQIVNDRWDLTIGLSGPEEGAK